MRIGVCTSPEKLPSVPEGLEYIEPTVGGLLCPDDGKAAFEKRREALAAASLPAEAVNCLFPGRIKTTGPDVDPAAVDAWFTTVARRAAKARVRIIVYGSGGSRSVPEGFDRATAAEQLVGHLRRLGPIASEHGVTLVLEPLNRGECNIANSVSECAEYVRAADHASVKLLVDTYHMAVDGEGPEAIAENVSLIAHAHCAEGEGRVPVGLGSEDHRPYFAALKAGGYDGRLSIEAKWDDFAAQLPGAVSRLRDQVGGA